MLRKCTFYICYWNSPSRNARLLSISTVGPIAELHGYYIKFVQFSLSRMHQNLLHHKTSLFAGFKSKQTGRWIDLWPFRFPGGTTRKCSNRRVCVKSYQIVLDNCLNIGPIFSIPWPNSFDDSQGYGHYLLHEQMNDPLEEMMGRLLEVNPSAATQLLESRGLVIMPTDLAEGLHQVDHPPENKLKGIW